MSLSDEAVLFQVRLSPSARRALNQRLPEAVAAAVLEFLDGGLRENPYRVGKPLNSPLEGCRSARRGEFRVIYVIDDQKNLIVVRAIDHRRDAYHT